MFRTSIAPKSINPEHHGFNRHTILSWARLQQPAPYFPMKTHDVISSELNALPTATQSLGNEDATNMKRIIAYAVIAGIVTSVVLLAPILGILVLIFSLKQISRSTYSGLFLAIGTTYGSSNGIDTFILPDFRARFPLGSAIISDASLVSGGNASFTLT
ncbi:unnamed protein product, partial [Rotaria magnacalcarata]